MEGRAKLKLQESNQTITTTQNNKNARSITKVEDIISKEETHNSHYN